jgi:hypothetical protein
MIFIVVVSAGASWLAWNHGTDWRTPIRSQLSKVSLAEVSL